VVVAGLTACGGDDEPEAASTTTGRTTTSSSTPAETRSSAAESSAAEVLSLVVTEANFEILLDRADLTAGEYEIEVANEDSATHDLVIERDGEDVVASDALDQGESTTVTVTLEPGEYVFYCSFHRGMGMEITVQVT
jgi:plastocyanin